MAKKLPEIKVVRSAVRKIASRFNLTGDLSTRFTGVSSAEETLSGLNQTMITVEIMDNGGIELTLGGFLGEPTYCTYRGDERDLLDQIEKDVADFNGSRIVVSP